MATAHLGTLLRHIHRLAGEPPGSTRGLTDRQLLDDFAAHRDEAAFATLVARHGPMVLRVCRRVLNHEQDAEDAFQATFQNFQKELSRTRAWVARPESSKGVERVRSTPFEDSGRATPTAIRAWGSVLGKAAETIPDPDLYPWRRFPRL